MKNNIENIFDDELQLIENEDIRALVCGFLENRVPAYFFEIPASSTGKYHPSFDNGEGGLVRHSKMTVAVCKQMLRLDEFSSVYEDCVIAALLLHDTFKNGDKEADCGYTQQNHPETAAEQFLAYTGNVSSVDERQVECIYQCILWHMGQWSGKLAERHLRPTTFAAEIRLTQYCDYIASRKFFNKYENKPEYNV